MTNHNALINMIKQQLRTGLVLDENILDLYDKIPRYEFVPEKYKDFSYSDMQIPLSHDQCMLTPLEEGIILQSLNLKGTETVLEIGTGSGFFTALLSQLCKNVISIEYFEDVAADAKLKLAEHNCNNVEVIHGDASRGWLDTAPYDIVVYTGAVESLSETQRLQVLPGGKLFAIIGKEPVMQAKLFELDHHNQFSETFLFETSIPLLIDKLKEKVFTF